MQSFPFRTNDSSIWKHSTLLYVVNVSDSIAYVLTKRYNSFPVGKYCTIWGDLSLSYFKSLIYESKHITNFNDMDLKDVWLHLFSSRRVIRR